MLRTPSAFAAHPDEFVPQVISLDASPDALGAFSSERAPTPASPPVVDSCGSDPLTTLEVAATAIQLPPSANETAGVQPASARRKAAITLRVPKWAGTGSLAVLGGALSGLVIAATLGPSVAAVAPPAGAVIVTSEPAGAPVFVDEVAYGATPLKVAVPPGMRRVRVGSGITVREGTLAVAAGGESAIHVAWPPSPAPPGPAREAIARNLAPEAAAIPARSGGGMSAPRARAGSAAGVDAHAPTDRAAPSSPRVTTTAAFRPVPSGWLSISAAFPVTVYEDGVEVPRDPSGRLVLPVGPHALTLVNDALEFRQDQPVTIAARRTVSVAVDTPVGALHVNARPWATVWVDGKRAGDTPIGNLAVPIGEHEVVLRHPALGEQRRTVVVGARTPARVGVEWQP